MYQHKFVSSVWRKVEFDGQVDIQEIQKIWVMLNHEFQEKINWQIVMQHDKLFMHSHKNIYPCPIMFHVLCRTRYTISITKKTYAWISSLESNCWLGLMNYPTQTVFSVFLYSQGRAFWRDLHPHWHTTTHCEPS